MAKNTSGKQIEWFIPRGDSFDVAFADYLFDEKLQNIRQLMADRRFTVGETDVAYRVINHWAQVGVLPDGVRADKGWRKFTLPEMVWLRVVCRLRNFGLGLEKVVRVKEGAMEWNNKTENYPYFEYYVARALASSDDIYICVTADGRSDIATAHEVDASKLFCGSFDVLLISIKSVLEEMGLSVSEPDTLFTLTTKEKELLAALRLERNNEVRAKISSDGEISEIESTTTTTRPLSSQELKETLSKNKMYGRVVTQYEDGKPKSVQVTKRKKF